MSSKHVIATLLLMSATALAGQPVKWAGSGTAYSPDGRALGTYKIQVSNVNDAKGLIHTTTTITEQNGKKKVWNEVLKVDGTSFQITSNFGNGGGACFGSDMCESYITSKDVAFATTIVSDGPNSMRDLTTELKGGQAVKIMSDKLNRVK